MHVKRSNRLLPFGLRRNSALAALAAFVALAISPASFAQTNILTHHYDTGRTGQNLDETKLKPANVSSTTFGKLFALPVDGYVYAQPLYMAGLAIPGQGTHNVVFIATEHDSLYAFDADAGGAPLWHVSFLINGATTLSTTDVGNTQDINPEIGITGTPTIDSTTNTLYVVVNTKENGAYIYRLHAVDVTTGAEKFGGPVQMNASVPGTSPDSVGGSLAFDVQWENQRPGLLLLNGYIFAGFASHGDNGPWHGVDPLLQRFDAGVRERVVHFAEWKRKWDLGRGFGPCCRRVWQRLCFDRKWR